MPEWFAFAFVFYCSSRLIRHLSNLGVAVQSCNNNKESTMTWQLRTEISNLYYH